MMAFRALRAFFASVGFIVTALIVGAAVADAAEIWRKRGRRRPVPGRR